MKSEEFIDEMKKIESCWPSRLEPDKALARRDVLWERLSSFPVQVLHDARNNLIDADLEFMPSVSEIIQACREVGGNDAKMNAPVLRQKFKPAAHACSKEKPCAGAALESMMIASAYEGKHILCHDRVPATCPACGARRVEIGLFDGIMEKYPDQTVGWTRNYKGLLLCQKCEKHG